MCFFFIFAGIGVIITIDDADANYKIISQQDIYQE